METMQPTLEERRATHLVETDWLQAGIDAGDPALRIVDMRGFVRTQNFPDGAQTADYVGAPEAYAAGHIPGAVYLDWTRDIVDENDPVPAQVAPAAKLKRILEAAGIGDDHLVVAYDAHPAAQFATRLWWVFRYYGHTNVRVLDGGWPQWVREGRPVTTEPPRYPPTVFTTQVQAAWRATVEQVRDGLGRPDWKLLDARDEGQYTGRIRRGKHGGHIPGAIHLPRERFFTEEGRFRTPSELQALVDGSGVTPDSQVVAYCNGGV